MKKYEEYKDSNIEWLGEIPSHWELSKLKYSTIVKNGFAFKSDNFTDIGVPVIKMSSIKSYGLDTKSSDKVEYKNVYKNYLLKKDDILVGMSGSINNLAKVSENNLPCLLNQRVGSIRTFSNNIYQNFLWYVINSDLYKKQVTYGKDSTAQINISEYDIGLTKFFIPPLQEQQQIASYLDYKTSKIDELISKKEELIKTLKNARQKLISETVTKGLDKDVKMKDSGVEWIGEIPEHWEVKKLKYAIESVLGGDWGDEPKLDKNDVICLRVSEFNKESGSLKKNDFTIRNLTKVKSNKIKVKKGSILVEKSGGGETCPVGNAVIVKEDIEAVYSNFIVKLEVDRNVFNEMFINYILRSIYINKLNLLCINQTTGIQNLNIQKYLETIIPILPIKEQQQIVFYLDDKTSKIDELISKTEEQIEILKKAKQSLITEVVTGKIDVRGWTK